MEENKKQPLTGSNKEDKVESIDQMITRISMEISQPKYIDEVKMTDIDLARVHLKVYQETGEKKWIKSAQYYIKRYLNNGREE